MNETVVLLVAVGDRCRPVGAIKKELVSSEPDQALILNANTIKKEIVDEVEDGNVDEFITRYNSYLNSMQSAKGKVSPMDVSAYLCSRRFDLYVVHAVPSIVKYCPVL